MGLRSIILIFVSLLLIIGGLFSRSRYSAQFQTHLVQKISDNLQEEFRQVEEEAASLMAQQLSPVSATWDQANHYFIHADSSHIITWNRNYFLPGIKTLQSFIVGRRSLMQTPRGDFLVLKWKAENSSYLYGIITLTDRYPIANSFLSTQANPVIFPLTNVLIANPLSQGGDLLVINNEAICVVLSEKQLAHESLLSFLLLSSGIIVFLLGLWSVTQWISHRLNYDLAFITLFAGLVAVRLEMISFSMPSLFFQSILFDPKLFASSFLNASLGDLFLNSLCLLLLVVYLFRNYRKFRVTHWFLQQTGIMRWMGGIICLLACFFALLLPFNYIETIYHNSRISLDIQSLSFDIIGITALASVLVACVSSFLFIHVLFLTASHLFKSNSEFIMGCLSAAVIFLVQFYLQGQHLLPTLILGIIYFIILKLSGLHEREFRVSFQVFIYLIFSLLVFSIQNGWAVRMYFEERQTRDQFRFGNDFLTERDVLGEYLMDQARQHIENDHFIQVRMASPFLSKSPVVEKVRRVYLNNYFDRYEINIRAVSADYTEGGTFNVNDSLTESNSNFKATGYPGIYYTHVRENKGLKRYKVKVPVYYQRAVGFVDIEFVLKRVIPNNVYPELLVDNRFKQLLRNREFSFAIITNGKLSSSFGSFNYERDFQWKALNNPMLYNMGIKENGYFHIGIDENDGTTALVSANGYSGFYTFANLSFWFVIGLLFLFAGQGILGLASYFRKEQMNYSTRIQLFIFLAFLLPVLAVSITTLTLIGRSNEESITNDFLERSVTIGQNMAAFLSEHKAQGDLDTDLGKWLEENTGSAKIDISVYSPEGQLMATSQPDLFENQLISTLIDREAWKKIGLQRESSTVTNEQIGKLQYSCAYAAVLSPETGQLEAIVGLPFFESATFLQKSQALILSNILIVFAVVFILFSLISFFVSRSLTFPIRFIAKALGRTTLSGQNKLLEWNSTDEIGTLAKEYNRMVENLEQSKRALAQGEKESAWREMAKQVAHEIKNPLTPMKLTLQQMEQALKSGNLSGEKSQKSIDVLLRQVEILNEIAGSFSSFASMPQPTLQTIELNEFISGVANLFGAEPSGKISFSSVDVPLRVMVDPTSFSRAISNIIINALQSRPDGGQLEVRITLRKDGESVVIMFKDNGVGISEEVKDKVFQPQFTTKQSGSGLGLAITRQIVIHAGGKIWFESASGRGTTFHISLPLMK